MCMTVREFPWDSVDSSKLPTLWSDTVLILDVVDHIQWNTLTGLQQLSTGLFMRQRVLIFPTQTKAHLWSRAIVFKELFISVFSPGTARNLTRGSHCAIWSPNVVGKHPWMFYKPANEHFSHTAVNIVWSCFFFFFSSSSSSCCCCAWCGSDVFIRLSKRKCLQLWQIPPEPVTLLVSMAVLQAAPQAGCVQGPIQPVFSAAAPVMFSPGAGVKPPSEERERERTLHSFSVSYLAFARCIAKRRRKKILI